MSSQNDFNELVHFFVDEDGNYCGAIRLSGAQSVATKRHRWLMTDGVIYADMGYWQATSIEYRLSSHA
jgi:hypothetical protein